jgi:hypothetical protein
MKIAIFGGVDDFNPDSSLARRSCKGRNPVIKKHCEADKYMVLSHLHGKLLIIWIPAFAGMTNFLLMNLRLSEC